MNKQKIKQENETKEIAEAVCKEDCNIHGDLRVRGRMFKGYIIKKFPKRIVIEFERTIYIKKYERYAKKKTKIHARLPLCKEKEVSVGDYVLVGECRPLSKIIHFVYVKNLVTKKPVVFEHDPNSTSKLDEHSISHRRGEFGHLNKVEGRK